MLVGSRRRFMGACAAVVAALGFPSVRAFAADPIGSEAFATMVKDRFHLASYTGTDEGIVKLISCDDIDVAPELDQFYLHMRGRRHKRLSEGRYFVSNWNGHPNFDLHVQPTTVDSRDREHYVASFALIR